MTPSSPAPDTSGADDLAAALDFSPPEPTGDASAAVPGFTVANPPGTVAVTTHDDGRVAHIDLAEEVTRMTEMALADEVLMIATLATQQARAAQYAAMLEQLQADGHDESAVADFLGRDLDLPSPQMADAALADVHAVLRGGRSAGSEGWGDRDE